MIFRDRMADEADWKDAVIARLNRLEENYFILKERLHDTQDKLEELRKKKNPSKRNKKRTSNNISNDR